MKQLLMGCCLLVLGSTTAFAISIDDAKSRGLIGERVDGYVGYVVTPPSNDVKVLVKSVNNKRREKFSESAKHNGIKTEQVAGRFYQRAVKATARGHYYQNTNGAWVKK